jgi:hypothetical protein
MIFSPAMIATGMGQSLAEGALEVAHEPIAWFGADGLLIITNIGIIVVTVLATMVEIYKLTKIENELKLITRFVNLVTALPRRMRHPVAHRAVKKIIREARRNQLPAPPAIKIHNVMIKDDSPLARSNRGHF